MKKDKKRGRIRKRVYGGRGKICVIARRKEGNGEKVKKQKKRKEILKKKEMEK